MIQNNNKILLPKLILFSSDVLTLLVVFFLARASNWAYDHSFNDAFWGWWNAGLGGVRLATFAVMVALIVFWFWTIGHYSRRKPFWDELKQTTKAILLVGLIDAALVFLGKWQFSRLWLFSTWASALVFVPLMRVFAKRTMLKLGLWRLPTLILGAGENAHEAAAALRGEPLMGLDVTAFITPPGEETVEYPLIESRIPVIRPESPTVDGLMNMLSSMNYPHVIVALDADPTPEQQKLLRLLSIKYADLNVIPSVRGLPLLGMEMTHFFSHEVLMLRVRNNLGRLGPQLLKRIIDVIAASLLLTTLAPLFAYLTWRIRQGGAPAVYAHTRVGRGGKAFDCLKFRSMVPDADEVLQALLSTDALARAEWARDFKLRNDPRITPVGAFLRRTSLDELPQLWNVLKGEMSLVGPRPVVEAELERYGDLKDYYLEARPGITGLWQISGRNDIDYSDRVNLDAWYVKNWSLWYDLVILLKTVKVVLRREGAY